MRTMHTTLLFALCLCSAPVVALAQPREAPREAQAQDDAAAPSTTSGAATESSATPSSTTSASEPEAAREGPAEAAQSGRAWIAHLPVSTAKLTDLRLRFDVRGDDLAGEIVVYYRPLADPKGTVRSVRAKREAESYVAVVPPESIEDEGIAYWVVERDAQGTERAVFASLTEPQPVHAYVDGQAAREARLLRLAGGRRSRVTAKFDWVDMGGFKVNNPAVEQDERDHYYHAEAQYAYRFFRVVEELEVALGNIDGRLLDTDTFERERAALRYGRTAITFAFGDWVRLRPGLLLGISTVGFEIGGDLALVLGDRDGTEFELAGRIVSRLGGHISARLGWATVPRVPMGARIEVTNFPDAEDFGVRLLFDVGYRIGDAFLVRAIGGYRGRTSLAGGPSLGLELTYAF